MFCTLTFIVGLISFSLFSATTNAQKFNCQPCVNRSSVVIRGIVHGRKSDDFWQRVHAAALQVGKDMKVDLRMELYDSMEQSTDMMAGDIVAAAMGEIPPDALVVSIPTNEVATAVKTALDAGVPVFGLNSGYDIANDLGVLGFVAMDEYIGGVEAANAMMHVSSNNVTRALFINHEKGNSALDSRREGFADRLAAVNEEAQVEELIVNLSDEADASITSRAQLSEAEIHISDKLEGCHYDSILLAGSMIFEYAKRASDAHGCSGKTKIGTFDANSNVFDAISSGDAAFGITQQEYLQGVLPIIMASIYVTTGKRLNLPVNIGDYGVYMSGPKVFTMENSPSEEEQACMVNSFPVCPNDQRLDDSLGPCACKDRSSIVIGGVLNDPGNEPFWKQVVAAASQAADDMGVILKYSELGPNDFSEELLHDMARRIQSMCEDGVDGIFVAIPSDIVVPAIASCMERGVQVVNINAGAETSETLGLMHHIGQLEYVAGQGACHRLVSQSSQISRVFCISNFSPSVAATARCGGCSDAVARHPSVSYGGMVDVPQEAVYNSTLYKTIVEESVGQTGDWSNIGLLSIGKAQLSSALKLHADHPKLTIGTFDLPLGLYDALEEGIFSFGIDQQEYLQGYFPVVLLSLMAYTNQRLYNHEIETGPNFIDSAPSKDEQICEKNFHKVCAPSDPPSFSSSPPNFSFLPIVAVCTALGAIIYM